VTAHSARVSSNSRRARSPTRLRCVSQIAADRRSPPLRPRLTRDARPQHCWPHIPPTQLLSQADNLRVRRLQDRYRFSRSLQHSLLGEKWPSAGRTLNIGGACYGSNRRRLPWVAVTVHQVRASRTNAITRRGALEVRLIRRQIYPVMTFEHAPHIRAPQLRDPTCAADGRARDGLSG
jgi:hypothetical protein